MEITRQHLVRALRHIDPCYALVGLHRLSKRAFAVTVSTSDRTTKGLVLLTHSEADRLRNADIARDEYCLLEALRGAGLPVAEPLVLDRDHAPPFFLSSRLPGSARFAADDRPALCRALAAALAEVHAVDLRQRDLSFLPWQAERVAEFLDAGGAADERIRYAMRRAADGIKPGAPALLHGDFWPGNLLWLGETLSGIIDWEDAMLGDPLGDLGKSRLEMLWSLGEAAMGDYTAHYLALNPQLDASMLPFWDLWGAARLPHFASFAGDAGRVAAMRRQYNRFVEAAISALEARQE